MESENTTEKVLQDGYDLPVYGLADGTFYYIHIPAICCIVTSLCCAIIVLVLSFRRQDYRTFFTWTKSERFVVYLAICDGLFNVAHSIDHLHMVITRDHVYPKELCEFYGFTLAEFITAQNLMVNIVAVNAFMLMYFHRHLEFGRWDWKLLVWTFGIPFAGATVAATTGQFGTSGSFCYFDGVKGVVANICFTTVPLLLIFVMNTVLYLLTWIRIHRETMRLRETLGTKPASTQASHRAAKSMSLFVAAFFIQWWALAVYGVWALLGTIPQVFFYILIFFSNIGGILNLGVYVIIRRKSLTQSEKASSTDNRSCSSRTTGSKLSDLHQRSKEPSTDHTTADTCIGMNENDGPIN